MEEVIENYGLAKLMDEVKDDERLSSEDTKKYYQSLKQNVEDSFLTELSQFSNFK